ncbi:protein kinase domain-containing protein [Paractinoplanes lichenicola]|uniref:Protein kinase domain-containing protein n=1 Tax=Paractinoplanes lichenicola TaxID=2802976 RepID=A0ABS1VDE3_9ACTN|nr:hypothetical protein [Actinoplanes lichenicola]MBL7252712.1 hypothetical protein [Actinoplanes lichenicola]
MRRFVLESDGRRRTVSLGARVGTVGAQGDVWRIVDAPGHVAKILRSSHRDRLDERLDALAALRPTDPDRVAWPVARVLSPGDEALVGLAMPYLSPATHRPLTDVLRGPRKGPDRTFATAAADLAGTLARLHRAGVVVGDLAPANVLTTRQARLTLIDADGWQLPGRPGRPPLPCPFSRDEYKAPELLGRPPGVARTDFSDRWALAVIVAELLVGLHPFAGVAPDAPPPYDEVANVEAGRCWLLGHPMTLPDAGPPPKPPASVQRLFEACFGPGRTDPRHRPTASAWAYALSEAAA